ncbi:MAG: class I SAM-dependent methyltransferase [bacterium]|nr:class I SAM-dependent methyltransferase [bacterium]
MIKDTAFYNKESIIYSEKRYPVVVTDYIQFFFKTRLRFVLEYLTKNTYGKQRLTLLEIGCADGIILREIKKSLGPVFVDLIGTDISPEMIRAAQEKNAGTEIRFMQRSEYIHALPQDYIIEIGVINYAILVEELEYIAQHLKKDGIAIISLAGTGSLWDIRRKNDSGFKTFLSYMEYEAAILKHFTIEKSIAVGLPIPIIWRVPPCARILQPLIEKILWPIAPNLFHEKIYIIKLKDESKSQE